MLGGSASAAGLGESYHLVRYHISKPAPSFVSSYVVRKRFGNNNVSLTFQEKGGRYSELNLDDAANATASVNAGDYHLYVGGSNINMAFMDLFIRTQKLTKTNGRQEYAIMHKELLNKSFALGGKMVTASTSIDNAEKLLSIGIHRIIMLATPER